MLCVRRGGLGDTILCLPLLRALRERFPRVPLHFAGVPEFAQVLLEFLAVDAVRSVEGLQLWALAAGGEAAGRARERLLGYQTVVGDAPELLLLREARIETAVFEPMPRGGVHAADWALRQLGLPDPDPASGPLVAGRTDPGPGAPVLLHPGAGSPRKRWPRERFEKLARSLAAAGHALVVAAGPAELERDDPRQWRWPEGTAFHADAAGSATALAAVLQRSRACIGNDSGPVHLAAALSVPTVAVFGPTDPALWAPRGIAVRVVGRRTSGPPEAAVDDVLAALAGLTH